MILICFYKICFLINNVSVTMTIANTVGSIKRTVVQKSVQDWPS